MKRLTALVLVSTVAALAAPGCKKKKNWGKGCEKAAEMTSPWTELGLPIDPDDTRICESSPEEIKLRSFVWKNVDEIFAAFEAPLLAAGYEKDECKGPTCHYEKGDVRVAVQPFEFTAIKGLYNVSLRQREKAGAK
jgi:hypothetical protein